MKLLKACEHGMYDSHRSGACPGGEFLADDDALNIWWCQEHQSSGWGGGKAEWCHLRPLNGESDNGACRMVEALLIFGVLAADQVGGPG